MKIDIKTSLFCILLTCLFGFINIASVHAATSSEWYQAIIPPNQFYLYDCNADGCNISVDVSNAVLDNEVNAYSFSPYWNNQLIYISTNGIMPVVNLGSVLKSGYLYSIEYYTCTGYNHNSSSLNAAKLYFGLNNTSVTSRPSDTYEYLTQYNNSLAVPEHYPEYYNYCSFRSILVVPNQTTRYMGINHTASSTITVNAHTYGVFGVTVDELGIYTSTIENAIDSVVSDSGLASASSVEEVQTAVSEVQAEVEAMNEEQVKTNEKLDEIMDTDVSDEDKELPDDSGFQDYTDAENTLKDKVNEADMSVISIGIDSDSSNWIWDTLTSLIKSHSVVFGMFIAILSVGIIKLALGR